MILFNNKYRVESARLKHWNYANTGMYFVTICTDDKIRHFGEIIDGNVRLNKLGQFAVQCWEDIPKHFPFVKLDEFIIMPNHVHGIIEIDNPNNVETLHDNVETQDFASLPNKFGPQSKNLGSIIRGFKIGVTKYANKNNIPFKWQPRFYDRVIRNENELENIQIYIKNNAVNWGKDKYYID